MRGWRARRRARSSGGPKKRLAEPFCASERLPEAARSVAQEGCSSAYPLNAEFAYEGLDLARARPQALRGLTFHPRHVASPRWLSFAARTLLPGRVVRLAREAAR